MNEPKYVYIYNISFSHLLFIMVMMHHLLAANLLKTDEERRRAEAKTLFLPSYKIILYMFLFIHYILYFPLLKCYVYTAYVLIS